MIEVGFKSDKGIKRRNNEDAYFIVSSENVYVVADGVGGGNSGEIASRTAVTRIAEYVRDNPLDNISDDKAVTHYFLKCINYAHEEICFEASENSDNLGMATTLVLAYISDMVAFIANVGDSRAYVCRGGGITQITEDHTRVNDLVKNGIITPAQAKIHKDRNAITMALGVEIKPEPDFFRIELQENDVILLCTDGLHSEVDDKSISEIANNNDLTATEICSKLVSIANRRGGHDNITVIALRI